MVHQNASESLHGNSDSHAEFCHFSEFEFQSCYDVHFGINNLRKGMNPFISPVTHSFILKQEPQPQCLTCQTTCMVKHIFMECRAFTVIRKRFFKVNNLTDLFENIKIDDILSFLRETEWYEKIWQLKTG